MEIHKTICDRCKKELVEKPVRQFTIYNGNVRVDLCEDCYRFFYTWMEKPDDLEIINREEYELLKEWQRNGHRVKVRSGRYKWGPDKEVVEKEEPPAYADNETGYDKGVGLKICGDADNNICDSCAFNTRTGYFYEICDNCYKGDQFIPKKEKECDDE